MRRIKMRTLRSILFLLLALVFAVLAIVEGLPKARQSVYSQSTEFTVTSQKKSGGVYTHLVQGSIRNDSSRKQFLDGVIVRFNDQSGETLTMEFEVGNMAPGEVRNLSGSMTGDSPAVSVSGVSTSALSGDVAISVAKNGLQLSKGFIIFSALAILSFAMAAFFFINRILHNRRHHHHHHHHHHQKTSKTSENKSQEA